MLFDPALTMASLRISPLSWSAELQGDQYAAMILDSVQWEICLRRQDGFLTAMETAPAFTYTREDGEGYILTVGRQFETFVDVSDVAAVIINGMEFPVS